MDFILMAMIGAGLGASVIYLYREFDGWRRDLDDERRAEQLQRRLHSARLQTDDRRSVPVPLLHFDARNAHAETTGFAVSAEANEPDFRDATSPSASGRARRFKTACCGR